MINKRKRIVHFLLSLIIIFIITGCSQDKKETVIEDSDKFLITYTTSNNKNDIEEFMNPSLYIEDSHVNLSNIYYTGEIPDNIKYSNITSDGKINWNKDWNDVFDKGFRKRNIEQVMDIDNKAIVFPLKFSDIDEEYKNFDDVNWNKISMIKGEKEYNLIRIQDKLTNNIIFCITIGQNQTKLYNITNKNNEYVLTVILNGNKIVSIGNILEIGRYDIKIDGIGLGSTLNEMYEKLGMPNEIHKKKDKNKIDVYYQFEDLKSKNTYGVNFVSLLKPEKIYGKLEGEDLKLFPNIVTQISIYTK